jgi:cyclohexyl-isocyanide hydratase
MNRLTFTAITGAMAGALATKTLAATPQTAPVQRIAMVVYPQMTQLDLMAPQLLFASLGNVDVQLVWKDRAKVVTDTGVTIIPDSTFDETKGGLTVLFVPGGTGSYLMMNDPTVLSFLRRVGPTAEYVTSVCSGSLVLAAAGLLRGYRATSHWIVRDQLALLGAIPVAERVVIDRNRITGAGVTAGLDFGLRMSAKLRGDDYARMQQLLFEYDPQPPFDAGSEANAGEKIDREARIVFAQLVANNNKATETARERLGLRS